MFRFIVRRLLIAIPLLIAASFLCFALTTAMGDPLGDWKLQRPRTEGEIAAQYQRIGYDKPVLERYVDWADGFVVGDWKTHVTPGNGAADVREEIGKAFWVTARLVIGAEIIAVLIGMMVGVVGAVRQYSWFDYTGGPAVTIQRPNPRLSSQLFSSMPANLSSTARQNNGIANRVNATPVAV